MAKIINKENIFDILKEFENGKQTTALKKIERYIKFNKDDYKTRYNFAVMLDKNGQKEKAIWNYKKVLEKDPNDWRSLSNLYLIYFDQQKFSESLILVNKLLNNLPNHQPTLRDKAHIQFYLNDLVNAKQNAELMHKCHSCQR